MAGFDRVAASAWVTDFGELTGFGELTDFGGLTAFGEVTDFGEVTCSLGSLRAAGAKVLRPIDGGRSRGAAGQRPASAREGPGRASFRGLECSEGA